MLNIALVYRDTKRYTDRSLAKEVNKIADRNKRYLTRALPGKNLTRITGIQCVEVVNLDVFRLLGTYDHIGCGCCSRRRSGRYPPVKPRR